MSSSRSKEKAARSRIKNQQLKVQEQQKQEARVQALKTMTSGFARTVRTAEIEQKYKASKLPVYARTQVVQTRSLDERFPLPIPKQKQQLSEEMQRREAAAKEKYEIMKTRVAPIANKMGAQYLSESELAAERKGELRRRS